MNPLSAIQNMIRVTDDGISYTCPITGNRVDIRRQGSLDFNLARTGTNFHIGTDGIRLTQRGGASGSLDAPSEDLNSIGNTLRSAVGSLARGNPLSAISGSNGLNLNRRGQGEGSSGINIGGGLGRLGLGGQGGGRGEGAGQGGLNIPGLGGRGGGEGGALGGLGRLGLGGQGGGQAGGQGGAQGGLNIPGLGGLGGRGGQGGFGLASLGSVAPWNLLSLG